MDGYVSNTYLMIREASHSALCLILQVTRLMSDFSPVLYVTLSL